MRLRSTFAMGDADVWLAGALGRESIGFFTTHLTSEVGALNLDTGRQWRRSVGAVIGVEGSGAGLWILDDSCLTLLAADDGAERLVVREWTSPAGVLERLRPAPDGRFALADVDDVTWCGFGVDEGAGLGFVEGRQIRLVAVDGGATSQALVRLVGRSVVGWQTFHGHQSRVQLWDVRTKLPVRSWVPDGELSDGELRAGWGDTLVWWRMDASGRASLEAHPIELDGPVAGRSQIAHRDESVLSESGDRMVFCPAETAAGAAVVVGVPGLAWDRTSSIPRGEIDPRCVSFAGGGLAVLTTTNELQYWV